MRYFEYVEPLTGDFPVTIIMSEYQIKESYYPYWYDRMCNKFGKDFVDTHYTFEECIQDWMIVNWAWQVN